MKMLINKIYNEDCLNTMSRMGNEFIDMIITSPPYDKLKKYEGYDFDFENIAKELYRVLKNPGILVWIVGDSVIGGSETGTSFEQALYFKNVVGFKLHDTMIYEKNSSTFPAKISSNRYTQIFEYMFILAKGKIKSNLICDKKNRWAGYKDFSKKLKNPVPEYSPRTNIWKYTTSFNDKTKHPAPFPESLCKDHIITWTNVGDLVYDPFIGSGTTAKMCILNNRKWIGSEVSKKYCDTANERLTILYKSIKRRY